MLLLSIATLTAATLGFCFSAKISIGHQYWKVMEARIG
jgi:hypothetical protein